MMELKQHLVNNGFSSDLSIKEFSTGRYFKAILFGNTIAKIDIRSFYSAGAPLDGGTLGYAKRGSNNAIVYGKGRYFGRDYLPSITDLVNVTTHELGHGIFSFGHTPGVMFDTYKLGSPLQNFTNSQIEIIKNSIWGK